MRVSCLLCLISLAGCGTTPTVTVPPAVETEAVGSRDDAADDPAIWVNENDPANSLIIGTDKNRGLELYELSGERIQALPAGNLNNVDLRADFQLGQRRVVLVAASDRTHDALAFFRLDVQRRRLIALNRVPVSYSEPYGLCLYQNEGETFVFMGDKMGHVNQWMLSGASGEVRAELVRELRFDSQTEGCTVDEMRGLLYVGEEAAGVWRLSADPTASADRALVGTTGAGGHLTADVEGLDLYRDGGRGYLVVSSQGNNSYAVYARSGGNEYLGSFRITASAGSADSVSETDGLALAADLRTDQFPSGLLVVQDGSNTHPASTQNFKLVSWRAVARALELSP